MLSTRYAAGRSSRNAWAVDLPTRYLRSTRVSCGASTITSASDTVRRADRSSGRASANNLGLLLGHGLRPGVRRVRDRVAHGHPGRLADQVDVLHHDAERLDGHPAAYRLEGRAQVGDRDVEGDH